MQVGGNKGLVWKAGQALIESSVWMEVPRSSDIRLLRVPTARPWRCAFLPERVPKLLTIRLGTIIA